MVSKQELRDRIWAVIEKENLAAFPKPCRGRIPNFKGSEKACRKISELAEFKNAICIFCAPDYVLKKAREIVIESGKILAVATPHMKKFLTLSNIPREKIGFATTIKGFERYGRALETKVDIFVQGAVAVDLKGNRIGKGSGYGDKEYWYLKDRNLLAENAVVVAVAHTIQIIDDFSELMNENDVKVNYIITPEKILPV